MIDAQWDRFIFYDGIFFNARIQKRIAEFMECFYFKYTEQDMKVYKEVLFA